jgi:hypothetical protein
MVRRPRPVKDASSAGGRRRLGRVWLLRE